MSLSYTPRRACDMAFSLGSVRFRIVSTIVGGRYVFVGYREGFFFIASKSAAACARTMLLSEKVRRVLWADSVSTALPN